MASRSFSTSCTEVPEIAPSPSTVPRKDRYALQGDEESLGLWSGYFLLRVPPCSQNFDRFPEIVELPEKGSILQLFPFG